MVQDIIRSQIIYMISSDKDTDELRAHVLKSYGTINGLQKNPSTEPADIKKKMTDTIKLNFGNTVEIPEEFIDKLSQMISVSSGLDDIMRETLKTAGISEFPPEMKDYMANMINSLRGDGNPAIPSASLDMVEQMFNIKHDEKNE